MRIRSFALASIAALALTAPAFAGPIFIPIGKPIYTPQDPIITPQDPIITPQPDLVTPVPDTVVTTPDKYVSTGSKAPADGAVLSDACTMGVIGKPGVRVQMPNVDANCTPLSIASTGSGYVVPGKTTRTPNAPIVTPQPDLVTPVPDLVTPQPDLCEQRGILIPGGLTTRPC